MSGSGMRARQGVGLKNKSEQTQDRLALSHPCSDDIPERPESNRYLRIDVSGDLLRRRNQRCGVASSLDDDVELIRASRPLTHVRVKQGLRHRADPDLLDVAHDADDRESPKISVHATEVNEPAERILAWPALFGERGTDHRNVRRVTRIALVEHATA